MGENITDNDPRFGENFRARSVSAILVGLALVCSVWFAIPTLRFWFTAVEYPGEIDWMEGVILTQANLAASGENIYAVHPEQRFIASVYGPLFYYSMASAARFEPYAYRPLRTVSLGAIFFAIVCAAIFVYRHTSNIYAAIFTGLLLPQALSIAQFGASCKPDSMALAFTAAGLALALPGPDRPIRIFAPLPLFVAALLCKLSFFAAPLCVAVLAFGGCRRRGCLFLAAFAGAMLASGAIAVTVFGAGFLTHQFVYNALPFDFARTFTVGPERFWENNWSLIFFAGAGAFVLFSKARAMYFALSLHAIFILGKAGANLNHWNEPLFAATLSAGPALARFKLSGPGGERAAGITYIATAILFFVFYPAAIRPDLDFDLRVSLQNDQRTQSRLRELIGEHRPLIFSIVPGATARFGNTVDAPISDAFSFKTLVQAGVFSDRLFSDNVRHRRFVMILLNRSDTIQERLEPDQFQLIQEYYEVTEVLPGTLFSEGDLLVLKPRAR